MVLAPALIASWQYCFALTGNAKDSIVAIIMKKFFVICIAALFIKLVTEEFWYHLLVRHQ